MTADFLLLAAGLALALGFTLGPRWPRLWLGLSLAAAVATLGAVVPVLAGGPVWEWRSGFTFAGEALHLRLDALSAWFLVLLAIVGGAGAVYSHEYWSDADQPVSAPRGRRWWSGMLLAMMAVLLCANGLHFLIAWELFAVSGYFLIALDRRRPAVRRAGWLYLAASHAGTLALFAFFALLAAHTGSWELGPMRDHPELAPLFWLALFGFGVKGGLFPLHIWLPSAHANAPSHVSALMSGVAIKLGVYGIVRFGGWLPMPPAAGWVTIGIGAVTALLGIAFAFAQNDLKRLLAYCSVENVGIVLIGLGGALLATGRREAAWGGLLLAGALLHVWNHGLYKSLLFLGAGSVLHATGTREMSRLGGLWRAMPWTAGLFALGAVAISGLPPLNGFVSEWLVYLGLLDAAAAHHPTAWATMPAAIVLATAGALALATFAKASATIFLGAPRTKASAHAHECGILMRAPMIVLALGCVVLALVPVAVWPALRRAAEAWRPGTLEPAAPAVFAPLGRWQLLFAVALVAGAVWLWRRVRAGGVRRALTWDCGYAVPTARMQYTSGSFAAIAAGWFAGVLQPERTLRRPRGFFPAPGLRLERVPETVLERGLTPIGAGVLRVAAFVRQSQHGRLQYYLVYVAGGLTAVGLLAWLGGKS